MLSYQSGSLIETDVSQELASRNTGHFLQLTMQLSTAYAHLITHLLYIEVRIAHVLVHYLHDTLHQLLIVAFHLYLLHLVVLLQGTAELTFQATHIINEIVYREMEFLQTERFCQISISSQLDALQTVADFRFGSEHDDRHMTDIGITLDVLKQRDTIHLRHHHIAYYQVEIVRKQLVQCFLAIVADYKAIPVAQFRLEITADFDIIIYQQDFTVSASRISLLFLFGFPVVRINLIILEMLFTQRQFYDETGTARSVLSVACCHIATMKPYDGSA